MSYEEALPSTGGAGAGVSSSRELGRERSAEAPAAVAATLLGRGTSNGNGSKRSQGGEERKRGSTHDISGTFWTFRN
ncbi:unnamed protein product [Caretta caretta]